VFWVTEIMVFQTRTVATSECHAVNQTKPRDHSQSHISHGLWHFHVKNGI